MIEMDKITGILMIIMGFIFFYNNEFIIGNIFLHNLSTYERWLYSGLEIAFGFFLLLGGFTSKKDKKESDENHK